MAVQTRSVLIGYVNQVGGISGENMNNILDSLLLASDDRFTIKQYLTPCGGMTLEGMALLINLVTFKEPPSQANSRVNFLAYLDHCGRFSRAEWVEFLNKTYLVNEGVVNPADRELYLAVVDNNNGAMTLHYDTDLTTLTGSPVMVAIGSSTMAGQGASSGFALPDRLSSWFNTVTGGAGTFVNLALGGYYSDKLLPDGESPLVDVSRNITRALSYKVAGKKLIILCSLASNDASINTNAVYMDNLRRIDEYARERGAIVFFSTTQPRTGYNATQQQTLYDGAALIKAEFKTRAIDVFNLLRDLSAPTLGVIKPELNSGDGVHVNNVGHGLLFDEYKSTLVNYFSSNIGTVSKYMIETSAFASGPWTTYQDNIGPTTVQVIVNPKNNSYYRVTKTLVSGATKISNVDTLTIVTTTTVAPPQAGLQRVLVDLGGDGNAGNGALTVSPDGFGNYWNNVTNVGVNNFAVMSNAKDTANVVTSLGLTVLTRTGGTYNTAGPDMNYGGLLENVGDYPASAVRDNAFVYNAPSTGGQWKLTGLLANRTYSVKFWGTRDDATTRITEIQRDGDGGIWQSYNSTKNRDYNNAAIFLNITGVTEVIFNLRVGAGSTFGHVSVLDIQSISNDLTTTTTTTTTIPPVTQRMLIDFGGNDGTTGNATVTPDTATGYAWNNITNSGIGTKLANMVDTSGAASGHALTFVGLIGGTFGAAGNQFNMSGPTTVIGDYPVNAVKDNIYANATAGTTGAQWTITGLRSNYVYRFKFWGSRTDTSARVLQIKKSTDSTWLTVETRNNTDFNQAIVIDNVTGVASITFDIAVASGSTFGHISVLDIQCINNAFTTTTTTTVPPPTTTVAPNARRMLIDLGGDGTGGGAITASPDANGRTWNNITSYAAGTLTTTMVTAANAGTSARLRFVTALWGTFTGTAPQGLNYGGYSGVVGDYPATACSDSFFIHSSVSGGGELRIEGLVSTNTYRIKFWGSRTGTTGVRSARIQCTNSGVTPAEATYNAVGNTTYDNAAVFVMTGVSTAYFLISTAADGSEFGYIGVIDIQWTT